MRKTLVFPAIALLACLIVLFLVVPFVQAAAQEEMVAFNTKSLKYHCLSCEWAIKCTVNCVQIPKSEAIRRGGVPCKVCGGTCKK